MRRPSAPLVISSVALFVALGGPAAAQRAGERLSGTRLTSNSVTGAKIKDGSLAAKELSPTARRSLRIPANRSVSAVKLAPDAVGGAAIASGAVGAEELAPGAVGASRLGADAVTSEKVADGSLRAVDLSRNRGEAQLDFPAIAPGACAAAPVNLPGQAGIDNDIAIVTPPSNWPAPIQVTALLGPGQDAFSVLACNFTGAPQDPGPTNFRYLVIDL